MKLTFLPALVVLSFLGLAGPASAQPNTDLVDGITALDNGNHRAALRFLRDARQEAKRREEAKVDYYLGLAHYRIATSEEAENNPKLTKKHLEDARRYFKAGIDSDKRYGYNYAGMGLVQVQNLNIDKAKANFQRAIETAPDDVELLITLAGAYSSIYEQKGLDKSIRDQAMDEATKLLTRAESVDSKNAQVKTALGDLYNKQGVDELALTNYKNATKLAADAKAFYKLGKLYLRLAQEQKKQDFYAKGQEKLLRAKELNPDLAPVYLELADLYFLAQQYQAAKDELETYRKLLKETGADATYANAKYATNLYLIRDYDAAAKELATVLQDTSDFVLRRLYGYSLVETGQHAEGLTQMKQFFDMVEKKYVIAKDHKYLAKAYAGAGDTAQALKSYDKLLDMHAKAPDEKKPDITGVHKDLYNIYKTQGKWEQALHHLQQSYQTTGNLTDLFYVGFYAYRQMKDYAMADSILSSVREKAPTFLEGHYYHGRALHEWENATDSAGNPLDSTVAGRAAGPYKAFVKRVEESGQIDKQKAKLNTAYGYLMVHYYRQNDMDATKKWHKKLTAIDPDNEVAKQIERAFKQETGG